MNVSSLAIDREVGKNFSNFCKERGLVNRVILAEILIKFMDEHDAVQAKAEGVKNG